MERRFPNRRILRRHWPGALAKWSQAMDIRVNKITDRELTAVGNLTNRNEIYVDC
jgi:hypothetical protein